MIETRRITLNVEYGQAKERTVTIKTPKRVEHDTVRIGSKGSEVKTMQRLLMEQGYELPIYGADGDFGNETRKAVKAFQAANGLSVDGVCGPLTWAALDVQMEETTQSSYTLVPMGEVGADIESLSYTDSAADNSDSIDITMNAQDEKWLGTWLPDKGATLRASIRGENWEREGQNRTMECGLFTLDEVNISDAPTTMQISGVSKPSDSDFSERVRAKEWKNTSIRRIGATIAARYGLAYTYDADDYDIECDEQDDTDSSYFNQLCRNYGLILKVYARRIWVYDREKYKEKRAVCTFYRSQIRPGSLQYSTTLSGTYTGGYFNYTDPDKDIDIVCSVGGGAHTKSISRRATSVYDASVQLCAELNAANHGKDKLSFGVDGDWSVCAAHCINISGYGKLDGKYFVDKATHKVSSGGFTTDFACSRVGDAFHTWEVGGHIEYHEQDDTAGAGYSSTYYTTSPAAGAASALAGGKAGMAITLDKAPLYVSSTAQNKAGTKTGTYYLYDGILINGRYRVTITASRCGKLPVGENVTGWVPASYCVAKPVITTRGPR